MKFLGILFLISAALAKHEIYSGWKSYYVNPSDENQLKSLGEVIPYLDLDFVSTAAIARPGVVLVKPKYQEKFMTFLEQENIEHWIHSDDVKSSLDMEDMLIEERKIETRANGARIPYENYQSLEVIYEYIDMIAESYPNVVTLVHPANSFEGRPIKYLKISNDNFQGNKPVIIIDAGMHAREWIGPPTVTYAIHKLVENVTEPELLDNFDWILLPVANPDGYKYSFESERMWRKTRSTDQHSMSEICPGVDGNRNFDLAWNTAGTSTNPCVETYGGSKPMSEVEVRVVDGILKEHLSNTILYLTMHSFGNLILYPWGHDGSLPENAFAFQIVGLEMADAMNEVAIPSFPRYIVGNTVDNTGYAASGTSEDYAHNLGVPFSFKYQLPGVSSVSFKLHPTYIKQVCEETWLGIIAGAKKSSQYTKK